MDDTKITAITPQQYSDYWQQFSFCEADEERYIEQANFKKDYWLELLQQQLNTGSNNSITNQLEEIPLFHSPARNYRSRIEFALRLFDNQWHYTMFDTITKEPIKIQHCQQSERAISEAMPQLIHEFNTHPLLSERCMQVNFRANLQNKLLITLIYRQAIAQKSDEFKQQLSTLQQKYHWDIIARSHKQQWSVEKNYMDYTIHIDNQPYIYRQDDNTFTQPNQHINQKMLAWVKHQLSNNSEQAEKNKNTDLLELYCGNGNFSIALANQFRHTLATEVVRESLYLAHYAKEKNAIENIEFVRLSAEETAEALSYKRAFRRLQHIDLAAYQFSTVLVDPPRSGIDEQTLSFLEQFERIIYISCNPQTFIENMNALTSHRITSLALFDQFPYTAHIESVAFLEKNNT